MIPALCAPEFYPKELAADLKSSGELGNAPILSQGARELFTNNYIPNVADRADPLFSPLLWPTGHKNQPPQSFQIAGADPLRDEALVYERELREKDGVKTKLDVYVLQPSRGSCLHADSPGIAIQASLTAFGVFSHKWRRARRLLRILSRVYSGSWSRSGSHRHWATTVLFSAR